MKRLAFVSSILTSLALLTACGGGSDAPSPEEMTGTYAVSLSKSSDNCGVYPSYNGADHQVVVGTGGVTVSFNGQYLFGSVNGSGGFTATASGNYGSANSLLTLTYSPSGGNTYSVTFTGKATASNGASCSVTYNGTATKR
ncbi:MAG: hypothetical protein JNK17_02015 [Hydrogenophaga sp.]|nr:hypothetical protein [Hydrogenophaga sp.]